MIFLQANKLNKRRRSKNPFPLIIDHTKNRNTIYSMPSIYNDLKRKKD